MSLLKPDMYSQEAEEMLAGLERREPLGPALAACLRRLRDAISDPDQVLITARWAARHEAEELDELASDLRERGVPARVVTLLQSPALTYTDPMQRLDAGLNKGIRMCVLGGAAGTGKTVTACRLMYDLRRGRYIKAVSYAGIQQNEEWRRQIYQTAPVLVIDDLGMDPDHLAWRMNELLSVRYDGPDYWFTLITTNLDKAELERRYSKPIMQRIVERGGHLICTEVLRRSMKDQVEADRQRELPVE